MGNKHRYIQDFAYVYGYVEIHKISTLKAMRKEVLERLECSQYLPNHNETLRQKNALRSRFLQNVLNELVNKIE